MNNSILAHVTAINEVSSHHEVLSKNIQEVVAERNFRKDLVVLGRDLDFMDAARLRHPLSGPEPPVFPDIVRLAA